MRISMTTAEVASRLGSEEAALRALAEAGFDACDFSMWDPPWHGGIWDAPKDEFEAHFTRLRRVAEECGIAIHQTHAPFGSTDGDPEEDRHRLMVLRKAIRATALLGCRYIVIHPAKHMDNEPDEGHKKAMAYNLEMYKALTDDLREAGVQLALENMFGYNEAEKRIVPSYFSTAQEMLDTRAQLDPAYFCFCLDVGHSGLVGECPAAMARAFGTDLKVLHVHDNDGLHDQHQLPWLGTVNWEAFCAALRDIGYDGTLSLEAGSFVAKFPTTLTHAALRMLADTARTLAAMVASK